MKTHFTANLETFTKDTEAFNNKLKSLETTGGIDDLAQKDHNY